MQWVGRSNVLFMIVANVTQVNRTQCQGLLQEKVVIVSTGRKVLIPLHCDACAVSDMYGSGPSQAGGDMGMDTGAEQSTLTFSSAGGCTACHDVMEHACLHLVRTCAPSFAAWRTQATPVHDHWLSLRIDRASSQKPK